MKHIFFNNSGSCGNSGSSFDEGSNSPDPRIRIFDADTITALSFDVDSEDYPETVCSDRFVIVQASNQGIVTSPILEKKNVEKVDALEYATPVKQATTIALANISVSAGEEYTVKVVDVTNGYEPYPVQTVSYTAKTGDAAADVAEGLRNAFTNHPRSLVDVSGATTNVILTGAFPSLQTQEGISITSSPLAQSFSTSLSESLACATFTAVAPAFGSGTYNHVRYLEETSQGGQGFLYRATPFRAEKPVFYSDPNLTYDLLRILYRTNTTPNIAKSNTYVEYILAVTSVGSFADLEYLRDTFFG